MDDKSEPEIKKGSIYIDSPEQSQQNKIENIPLLSSSDKKIEEIVPVIEQVIPMVLVENSVPNEQKQVQ